MVKLASARESRMYGGRRRRVMTMLIVGAALWVVGSIHNGHVQVLQKSVQIPFLMGSLLFLVASVLNACREQAAFVHHGLALLGQHASCHMNPTFRALFSPK